MTGHKDEELDELDQDEMTGDLTPVTDYFLDGKIVEVFPMAKAAEYLKMTKSNLATLLGKLKEQGRGLQVYTLPYNSKAKYLLKSDLDMLRTLVPVKDK